MRWLPALTLVAVLTITASSEFELARTVLRLDASVAWALPVAIDTYVLAALRTGRDVLGALLVMGGTLGTAMAAHLITAQGDLPAFGQAVAATVIMVVLVVVAWRVHVLIEPLADDRHRDSTGTQDPTVTVTESMTQPAIEASPVTVTQVTDDPAVIATQAVTPSVTQSRPTLHAVPNRRRSGSRVGSRSKTVTDAELLAVARDLAAGLPPGSTPGRARFLEALKGKNLPCGAKRADQILDLHRAEQADRQEA
jgi:hypothetical protein